LPHNITVCVRYIDIRKA